MNSIPVSTALGLFAAVFGFWGLSMWFTAKAEQLHDWWNTRQMVMQDEDTIEVQENFLL